MILLVELMIRHSVSITAVFTLALGRCTAQACCHSPAPPSPQCRTRLHPMGCRHSHRRGWCWPCQRQRRRQTFVQLAAAEGRRRGLGRVADASELSMSETCSSGIEWWSIVAVDCMRLCPRMAASGSRSSLHPISISLLQWTALTPCSPPFPHFQANSPPC